MITFEYDESKAFDHETTEVTVTRIEEYNYLTSKID